MARAGEEAPGTMAALLGIADDDAEAACMRAEGDVWVANYNAPGQVVIAGTAEAVALAGELAKGLGAKRVMPIQVSGAFHTPLMQGRRADLRKALAEVTFLTPEVRVVANVDAHVHDDPADWPGLLSAQLCSPVRWRQTLETFAGLGLTSLVELGPGGVLSGLAKRSLPEIQSLAVSKPEDLDTLMDQIGAAGTWRAEPALHQGEHLYMSERVVVSPSSGIFSPESSLQAPGTGLLPGTDGGSDESSAVDVGELVGRVGVSEVRTPFAGQVIGWLAADGERVQEGQPLVWLQGARHPLMAIVLVTGGTRGIGAACVAWFLANGDQVATTYRSADPPEPPDGADPERFLRRALRRAQRRGGRVGLRRHRGAMGPGAGAGGQRRHHLGLADAAHERPGLPRRDRRQPHRLVPGGQAGRGQDAAAAHRPHHLRLFGRRLRGAPGTGELRRIQGRPGRAWPGPSPVRWAAGRSR